MVGQSSPCKPPFRNAQHHLKCRLILFSVETKRRDKMGRVQFSNAFDRGEDRAYSYFANVRRQPSVKLKIDMLRTSIGSCLGARGRKTLRSLLLKLFSLGLAFI